MATPEMVRAEDVEEAALAAVDRRLHDYYGPDEKSWVPWQIENYLAEIAEARAVFEPEVA